MIQQLVLNIFIIKPKCLLQESCVSLHIINYMTSRLPHFFWLSNLMAGVHAY